MDADKSRAFPEAWILPPSEGSKSLVPSNGALSLLPELEDVPFWVEDAPSLAARPVQKWKNRPRMGGVPPPQNRLYHRVYALAETQKERMGTDWQDGITTKCSGAKVFNTDRRAYDYSTILPTRRHLLGTRCLRRSCVGGKRPTSNVGTL